MTMLDDQNNNMMYFNEIIFKHYATIHIYPTFGQNTITRTDNIELDGWMDNMEFMNTFLQYHVQHMYSINLKMCPQP